METVNVDCRQTAVGDASTDEEEGPIAMAISNATEVGQEEGGAMATGDALLEQLEESGAAMPIGDSAEMPVSGATETQMCAVLEMPFVADEMMPTSCATPILIDNATVYGNMEFPSNGATMTPTSGGMAMPADVATAILIDVGIELPCNSATATPTTSAMAMPPQGATAMPVDDDMELPINDDPATPNTGAMAMPGEGATAMMFSIGINRKPSTPDVDLCKVCGQRHLLDENHEYNYLDEVDDELTCHICLQPLISPLDTPCGHTYCEECLTNFLVESDFCPVDRVPILLQNCRKSNVLVHKLLDKLMVSCPFREHCRDSMPRGELQGHLLSR